MDNSSIELIQKKPYFFSVAAVSDYIPRFPQEGKIKKADIGDTWDLKLKQNIDILNLVDKTDIYAIGFKAEIDENNAKQNAINMLNDKNLQGVCLNIIDENNNFGSDTNTIEFINKNSSFKLQKADKLDVSLELLDILRDEFNEQS